MDAYSWFRRSLSRPKKANKPSNSNGHPDNEQEIFGVTDQLIDFIKTFTVDTFQNFPLQDEEGVIRGEKTSANAGNVERDLSEWQERHATLVLSRVKELSQLRFKLCPRHLKERQFWRIYFALVKSNIAEYELRAIQLAKLRQMATENESTAPISAYEVEMSETKQAPSLTPSASMEHNLDSFKHDTGSGKE